MTAAVQVALIDDDPAVLDSLRLYLEHKGCAVACFTTAEDFLARKTDASLLDCVVTDVRMPGMSGLDLVRRLREDGMAVPVILITGHGDVDMAVTAIKLGAADFIEKPFDENRLLEAIEAVGGTTRARREATVDLSDLRARRDGLTERQRQVFELAVTGLSNKEIAISLCISPRTVENHRAWMMERIGARNLAELIRMDMWLKNAGG